VNINVWEYLEEYEKEEAEISEAMLRVLNSGKLVLGPEVSAFEEEFSGWCGVENGIGVANGTDAIFLACKALGLVVGDEVLTVSNTAVPTVSAITAAGGIPVFVDIDPLTYLMDVSKLESRITPKTKIIIPVHLFGQAVDMDVVISLAKKYNLKIIEDCAQAHGAEYKGAKVGGLGDIGAFSFYPTKILGTYGDGGMCITNDKSLAEKIKRLRFYGMEKIYYSVEQGYNSRLDELHAAVLRVKLTKLNFNIELRRRIAKKYNDELRDANIILPIESINNKHAYYLYVVRHLKRDAIINELREFGINLNISYPWPIHTMSGYDHLKKIEGGLPNTENAAKEIFSLPMYPTLTQEKQNFTIMKLKEIIKKYS
jgi:aminotransferase EvaB